MSSAAKRVQVAKHSLDVLNEVFKNGSKFFDILKVSEKLTSAIPVAGVVLVLIGDFLPDAKHEEILSRLNDLSNKIDRVRDDIKELKTGISWEHTQQQYGADVVLIEKGMDCFSEIGRINKSKGDSSGYEEKLMKLCAKEKYSLALDNLLNGVTGDKPLNLCILDNFYDKTGGNRPKISALGTWLLQLVCGGLMVIAANEALTNGKKEAEEVIKRYEGRLKRACDKVKSVHDDCMKTFDEHMKSDLNAFLDKSGSNAELVKKLSNFMTKKYDWLENHCLVYNDLHGFDQHCFNGYRVDSLHRNKKCGIVFFRNKGEPPRFSDRYDEAYEIVEVVSGFAEGAWSADAQKAHKEIVATLGKRGIVQTGCAVITRNPDLQFKGTFTSKIVSIVRKNVAVILPLQ